MPTEQTAHGIRVEFNDFVLDPHDPDHMFRALDVKADRVTFEDGEAVFWLRGVEDCRFPISAISGIAPFPTPELRALALEELRKMHPRAYDRWSAEEEARLTEGFKCGETQAELARQHQRQPGAIRSRLIKLGLIDEAAKSQPIPEQAQSPEASPTAPEPYRF
ncbi:hypothetical protein [Yinghuangia sp. YIM S09857]|uniref:hypothetical protein n=1 Tax=Yinghuangia sp. YIM S09857 TaxID=3436929 RepID=UPI003F53BFAB